MRVLVLLVLLVAAGPVAPASAADWQWPLDGPPSVSRPFDAPAHRYAAGHRGADLPSVPGAAVRAAGDGWVSYAGLVAGRGVVVVVHGDLRTTYEPVSAVVDVLAPVAAGDVIGVLEAGHLGCPAPACLHWGLRRGDDHLDPVRLVRPGPVRLLPVEGVAGAAAPAAASAAAPAAAPAATPAAARSAAVASGQLTRTAETLPPSTVRHDGTSAGLAATAAASVLGAAAAGVALRRRR